MIFPGVHNNNPVLAEPFKLHQLSTFPVSGSKCGGQLMGESGWFSPIDRDDDGTYDPHQNCLWTIIAPGNHVIELNFSTIDFPQGVSCEHNDFIQVGISKVV